MNATDAPTTIEERGPRITALAHQALGSDALQQLLEAGADALRDRDGLDGQTNQLISEITATYEPECPAFSEGDTVARAVNPGEATTTLGKVASRYLNEKGEWEYQVHHPTFGRVAYEESTLEEVR